MTREELIDKEANRLYPTFVQDREIFRSGVVFADEHPREGLVDIEKSVTWLSEHLPNEYDGLSEFITAYRKAMKKQ